MDLTVADRTDRIFGRLPGYRPDLILCRLSGFRKSDFTNPAFPVAYARTRERVSGRNGRKNNLESLTINEEIS